MKMNEKEHDFSTDSEKGGHCICKSYAGLYIPQRELSYCVAGGILALFFVFMAGFFWGKQCAMKDFMHKLNQDVFADQVAASLYLLADPAKQDSIVHMSVDGNAQLLHEHDEHGRENDSSSDNDTLPELLADEGLGESTEVLDVSAETSTPERFYYAQLIGFGTFTAADQFVKRITRRGFSVKVEKRYSKTARGKTLVWYQVITDMYTDKAYLEDVVAVLMKQEKLKDVRIVDC